MTDYSEALLELRHWTKVYADSMRLKQRKAALFAARITARAKDKIRKSKAPSAAMPCAERVKKKPR